MGTNSLLFRYAAGAEYNENLDAMRGECVQVMEERIERRKTIGISVF